MASQFLALARALVSVLFDRPLRVKLPVGQGHFYPSQGLVLPAIAGGAPEGDEGDDGEGDGEVSDDVRQMEEEEEQEGELEGDRGDGAPGDDATVEQWKAYARKWEGRAKAGGAADRATRKAARAEERAEELFKKLKAREDEDKSDTEKAIEKAEEEGRTEALTEAQKERRKDRLESAVTRAAAKKIKIGEGKDAKEVRFDDPEDAELYLERAIKNGDLDEGDLFDDNGKVKADLLAEALKEILEEKPRLAEEVGGSSSGRTADGDADQGRGSSDGSKVSMNDLLRRG